MFKDLHINTEEQLKRDEMRGQLGSPAPADGEKYCPKCHGLILKQGVNYGINPDAVCHCR